MESDEESRSSSQSNSSDSGNSRESSPAKDNSDAEDNTDIALPKSLGGAFEHMAHTGGVGGGKRIRSSSSSSSKSSSGSSSTSSSSESDDEDADADKTETGGNAAVGDSPDRADIADMQQAATLGNNNSKSPSSASSSSGSDSSSSSSSDEGECDMPEETERRSSNRAAMTHITGSTSPNGGQSSRFNNDVDAVSDMNISHEDLSDVSDMESEKRDCFKQSPNNNGDNDDDEDEDDDVDDNDDENEDNRASTNAVKDDEDDGEISNDSIKLSATTTSAANSGNGKKDGHENDLRNKLETKKQALQKANKAANGVTKSNVGLDDLDKAHDDDALDFEAEEGECQEICKEEGETHDDDDDELKSDGKKTSAARKKDKRADSDATVEVKAAEKDEELEEGEVSDEDEKRPEETEPKPVCRFYTRGQCTWGMSCRFLHPGVTDKGNYTMFESMVRSVPMPQSGASSRQASGSYANHNVDYHDYRNERPALHHRPAAMHHPTSMYAGHHEGRNLLPEVPVVVENAWERGLRTAKEMMRKANKRKEQDMDFEDKKMNLTLSPDELEKDPYYVKERPNSPSSYAVYTPPDRYARAPPYMVPYEDVDAYGRMSRYRELPPHRMPQYEDDRRLRPTREVIVQRVETVGRGDEWSDPWMRAKSPGGRSGSYERDERRRRDRRSYSSNSSYSSSNSSQSDSSSESSRSSSVNNQKRRYNSHKVQAASSSSRRHGGAGGRTGRSPSPTSRRPRRSPSSASLSYKRTAGDKKTAYSPPGKRKKTSSPPKKPEKTRRHRSSSSSDSDSSGSSYSDSDSGSSSSDSSSASKERTPQKSRLRVTDKALNERKQPVKKPIVEPTVKKRSPISIEIKKPATVGVSALASPTHSANSDKDNKKSRREELLKQLRAVEDAIAKKRSKLT